MKEKILLGFSGGSDSTASLFAFMEAGYEVIPLYLVLSRHQEDRIEGIERFCFKHSLKCIIADERKLFRKEIIEYFASEYMRGMTPNPCAMCNRYIKFPLMNKYMKENGCKGFSTGHYIRTENGFLFRSADDERDQTYFVSTARKSDLAGFINPVTSVLKKEGVRSFLEQRGIKPAEPAESREICFVSGRYTDFLTDEGFAEQKPGNILDSRGNVIGKHEGSFRYTIGERIGIGGLNERLFVSSIDPSGNIVYASPKEGLCKKFMDVESVEIFSDPLQSELKVKTRYRQKESSCTLTKKGEGEFRAEFPNGTEAATPGQIAVFYDGDRVVMSAVIR